MARPVWLVELIKKSFPGVFALARMTRTPVLGPFLQRWLFEGDGLLYLPADRVIAVNAAIESPRATVAPSQVVDYFIERAACHWIMDFCICREGAGCRDYPRDLGCLFLGRAAEGINPRLGRPVTRKEAREHVRRCRDAGLVHLIGRNRLDTVWLGVGPGDRLLTICNCCPCCCLWRTLPRMAPAIQESVSRMPGVTVSVSERCEGCGTCTEGTCFVGAIHLQDGRAVIGDDCRGCGRCVAACPNEAIEVHIDAEAWIEPSIRRIASLVDVS